MRMRQLGATNFEISELSIGTWGLSGDGYGPIAEGEATRVIERGLAMGVSLFETADSYGEGKMETLLGETLRGTSALVVTKWGTDRTSRPVQKRFEADYLRRAAEESQKRLGDVKTAALLHNPAAVTLTRGEATETMEQLVKDGLISSWGVSAGDLDVATEALSKKAPLLSVPYNVLLVQPLRSLADQIREQNTGVLAHSVLFYGLLAGKWAQTKDFRPNDHRRDRWPGGSLRDRIRHLDALRPLISGDVTTMRSAAVRFVLGTDLISSAVLGPRSGAQLDQIVRECRGELPLLSEGKLSALESRLRQLDIPR